MAHAWRGYVSGCGDLCQCDLAGHRTAGDACRHRNVAGAVGDGVRRCSSAPHLLLRKPPGQSDEGTCARRGRRVAGCAPAKPRRVRVGRCPTWSKRRGRRRTVAGAGAGRALAACGLGRSYLGLCNTRQSGKTPIAPQRALWHSGDHEYRIPGSHLDAQQLRALARRLMGKAAARDAQIAAHEAQVARYAAEWARFVCLSEGSAYTPAHAEKRPDR